MKARRNVLLHMGANQRKNARIFNEAAANHDRCRIKYVNQRCKPFCHGVCPGGDVRSNIRAFHYSGNLTTVAECTVNFTHARYKRRNACNILVILSAGIHHSKLSGRPVRAVVYLPATHNCAADASPVSQAN